MAGNDAKFLTSFDHQLIFHIMYRHGQFHLRQNKGEERIWEIWQKTKQQMLSKHRAAADGKNSQKNSSIGFIAMASLAGLQWGEVVQARDHDLVSPARGTRRR